MAERNRGISGKDKSGKDKSGKGEKSRRPGASAGGGAGPGGGHAETTNEGPDELSPRKVQAEESSPGSYSPRGRDRRRGGGDDEAASESAAAAAVLPDAPAGSLALESYQLPEASAGVAAERTLGRTLPQLRDIAFASFGLADSELVDLNRAVAESIIGQDDRKQVRDTTAFPFRAHCSLLITAADGSPWVGTGWFISPRTLVTAGHCVFIKDSGVPGRDGWVRSIRVMPGRDGTRLPFGAASSTTFRTVRGWSEDGDPNFDYGAIILPSADLGNRVGHLGFAAVPDAELSQSIANVSGYPGDKPDGTQWFHARRVISVDARKVYYDTDTMGGQSGSAVYRVVADQFQAVAVHAYGVGGGAVVNSGTRINQAVFDRLVRWKL